MIRLTIPILIEKVVEEAERPYYAVRPVFFASYSRNAEREDLAMDRLTNAMRFAAIEEAKRGDHRLLARWSFCPPMARHQLKLLLRMRKATFEGRFFFVVFEEFDRKLAFCPKIPEACFELRRGETLVGRAQDVLTEHYRRLEKKPGKCDPSEAATEGFVRLGEMELEIKARQSLPGSDDRVRFAEIQSGEKMNGAQELERVGRCLERLYPKRLQHAIRRDQDVGILSGLFRRPKELRRPVVLVGRSLVGKTAVVHEFVRRRLEGERKRRSTGDGRVWLLNPQRLVSGMCYIGQWEERLLAIIREARKREYVLYFDDLLGVFQAGKSRDSELSVGHLLKAQIEEKPLDVIAEATPEAWRRLKELDRGFADLFQVVHLREPNDEETVRILIRVLQDIESERGCMFEPSVLPLVIELQRRFARTRAFPGKAAEQLHQIAASVPAKSTVTDQQARAHFQAKTGIAELFLDEQARLERRELQRFFDDRIVGQAAAVSAMMDAIAIGKARLNDPGRPLSSLLFLGPTGVGKTECAKAMAEFVFGSAERMLRFDMNEFTGPDAVSRLIGDASRPRGSLTSALQRQPFTVLLLDEVEKAHEDVFDLLLQVLGDGRLTDAGGHTADFCNAVIILTSNLGARQSRMQMGFAPEGRDESGAYIEAAEKFFRPETFNRLDRVIPFHELTRRHIAGMVERLAKKALGRFGFRQRRMMLTIDPEVYERIVDHGFDPEYGARALRRAIEEHLVQPLASELASTRASALSTVRIVSGAAGEPVLERTVFVEAERHPACRETAVFGARAAEAVISAADAFFKRSEQRLDEMEAQLDDEDADYPARSAYFDIRDRLRGVRKSCDRLDGLLIGQRKIGSQKPPPPTRFGKRATWLHVLFEAGRSILEELSEAADSRAYLKKLADEAQIVDLRSFLCESVIQKAAFVELLLSGDRINADKASVYIAGAGEGGALNPSEIYWIAFPIMKMIRGLPSGEGNVVPANVWDRLLSRDARADSDGLSDDFAQLENDRLGKLEGAGVGLGRVLALEYGTHLHFRDGGGSVDIEITGSEEAVSDARQVIRVSHDGGLCYDFRTGLIAEGPLVPLQRFFLPLLPPPPEFTDVPADKT